MMEEARPEVSVIVVNWNGGAALASCLDSVVAAVRGRRAEVVLVDNASTDGSAEEALGAHPEVKLIRNGANVGFAGGANKGLSEASGEILLLLNPDAQIGAEALGRVLGVMQQDGRIGIAGCGSVDGEGRSAPGYEMSLPGQRGVSVARREGQGRDVAWVSGACLAARREMVEEVGPLDEGFFMYSEDVDWCYRARGAGWRVVTLPEVTIRHELGTSAAQVTVAARARWAAESRVRFYGKHYSPARARWLRARMAAAALLGMVWRVLPAAFSGAAREGVRAKWAVLGAALRGGRDGRGMRG